MKIWAHRGLSQQYPENTLIAFKEAAKLKGLTGIELDIQLTKDAEIVVIHDEKVERTTNGIGNVNEFTLKELKQLHLKGVNEKIPTINEVFDLLKSEMENGLLLNIELKNSIIPYYGMEEKIIVINNDNDLLHKWYEQNKENPNLKIITYGIQNAICASNIVTSPFSILNVMNRSMKPIAVTISGFISGKLLI